MQLKSLIFTVLMVAVLLISACAPAATPTPAGSGQPQISLSTNPSPPTSNVQTELIIDALDAGGQPLTGATVNILADMVGHSMGVMQGEAIEQGEGRYATFAPFSMSGEWKVTVEVRNEDGLLLRQDVILPVQ
ncbi:MAG: FixH family protein [Anaerolinea sp.]|jgi:hypothetical protein|nr:FixH family protein [Anaerolinea sp.]